ncbi:MAG: glycosyltransferase [Gammaproteobacteria bacterium]|nr:glycosyltransferase [Pseudomonadales bacterium]MCP5347329.1 glycosyltransferase [Pseudomonadales bacterium]
MNILLVTNTYVPHVGGVARSVEGFRTEFIARGHKVLVIAPMFDAMPEQEQDVLRVSAIQNFNASDFSVVLPLPKGLSQTVAEFKPDVVHSQHPFLLGMTAVRIARSMNLPLVFTHHTLYEQYTHYVPGDSPLLQKFVIELATGYANLADQVITPSESIRDLIVGRGVETPVEVIPTGVRCDDFERGDGARCRRLLGITEQAWIVGHMGRLALEKNIRFLAAAVLQFLSEHDDSYFLVVGEGDEAALIRERFARAGLEERLILTGKLEGSELADALVAMNVFAFSSHSETQGMVLTEAMAAGVPVVALDASGAREVVRDRVNGRLLVKEDERDFAAALNWVRKLKGDERNRLVQAVRATAQEFSMARSGEKALTCYRKLKGRVGTESKPADRVWELLLGRIKSEWDIVKSLASAGDEALNQSHSTGKQDGGD